MSPKMSAKAKAKPLANKGAALTNRLVQRVRRELKPVWYSVDALQMLLRQITTLLVETEKIVLGPEDLVSQAQRSRTTRRGEQNLGTPKTVFSSGPSASR
jgi:hypothetical protein